MLCVTIAFLVALSCTESSAPAPFVQPPPTSEAGRLVQQHCGRCHVSPAAASLDKQTWLDGVLPAMAPKLGINVLWGTEYYPDEEASADASIAFSDWMKIVDYYRRKAPDTLQVPESPVAPRTDLPLFSVRMPQHESTRGPATTMVAIDPLTRHLYTSDATAKTLTRWSQDLRPTQMGPTGLIGVDVHFVEGAAGSRRGIFTSIGTMRAVNVANGSVQSVALSADSSRTLASNLPRPVCAVPGDFNRDGRRDWIVCGFGHDTGALYVLEQQSDHTFEKQTIRNVPGAVDAHVDDFNGDGWLDVMVLFAHSDEGVWLFTNDQRGGFASRNLLRFPPVYGSSSFQLVDFNDDGALDILYTAGDNADYSSVLKPYHGVYIFMNRGDYRYEQSYFYHFDGATQATAADFDEDGDLDIGAIGFFADLKDPTASDFVYLEHDGALDFIPYTPPIQNEGRWISMEAGDYDGDADTDLVLGNFARRYAGSEARTVDAASQVPFLILENQRQ